VLYKSGEAFKHVGHRINGNRQPGDPRGVGFEFVHVVIDDASRLAFSQILPDQNNKPKRAPDSFVWTDANDPEWTCRTRKAASALGQRLPFGIGQECATTGRSEAP
jgi:hypothetical protein